MNHPEMDAPRRDHDAKLACDNVGTTKASRRKLVVMRAAALGVGLALALGIGAAHIASAQAGPDSVTMLCIAGTTPASGDVSVVVVAPRPSGFALPVLNCTVTGGDATLAGAQ